MVGVAGAALSPRKEEVKKWRQEQRQARDERKSIGSGTEDGREAQSRSAGTAAEGAGTEELSASKMWRQQAREARAGERRGHGSVAEHDVQPKCVSASSRKEEAKEWKQEQRRFRDEQRTATSSEGKVGSKSEKIPAETAANPLVAARAGAALSPRKEEVKKWRQEQRQARDERKSIGSGTEDGREAQSRSAGTAAEGAGTEELSASKMWRQQAREARAGERRGDNSVAEQEQSEQPDSGGSEHLQILPMRCILGLSVNSRAHARTHACAPDSAHSFSPSLSSCLIRFVHHCVCVYLTFSPRLDRAIHKAPHSIENRLFDVSFDPPCLSTIFCTFLPCDSFFCQTAGEHEASTVSQVQCFKRVAFRSRILCSPPAHSG